MPMYVQCIQYAIRLTESAKVRVCVQFLVKKLKSVQGDVNDTSSPGTSHCPDALW
jgi:hypothetical protein